jgi:uncharacterized protein (TIGR03086 family)
MLAMPDEQVLSTEELIALGRDREAVASALTPGGTMDGAAQLREIIPMLETVVAGISPGQLDAPTPCSDFTVTGVLEHMIGGATAFAPAFRGQPAPLPTAEGDVTERWRRAMTDLLDAVHSPGALERTIASPFGELPGSQFARYVAFDGLVHGWDLATATGQPYAPADDLVAAVDGYARGLLVPQMRDGDTFALESEVSPGASRMEQLVAFSGRRLPVSS